MKLLVAIGIIALISVIGSRLIFIQNRLPLGIRHLLITGTEYVLIGMLLGKIGLNILDPTTIADLEPFLIFGLCWIGFMYGLQFEIRLLKSLPRYYFSITFIQSFVTFLCVFCTAYLAIWYFVPFPFPLRIAIALTLGSMSACSAQSAVAIISKNYAIENRSLLDLLRYITGVDGVFALLFFTLGTAALSGVNSHIFSLVEPIRWLLISASAGILPGLILIILSRTRFTASEYMVFVLGTILFCGGLAFQLKALPLVSGFVCGIVTANLCRHRLRALSIVVRSEKTIYIILLLLIGAIMELGPTYLLFLIGLYIFVRIGGKIVGVYLATRIFRPRYPVPATLGLSLIAEGGLAAAIVLDVSLLYPDAAQFLIPVLVFSLILNELIAPRFILSHLVGTATSKAKTPVIS